MEKKLKKEIYKSGGEQRQESAYCASVIYEKMHIYVCHADLLVKIYIPVSYTNLDMTACEFEQNLMYRKRQV